MRGIASAQISAGAKTCVIVGPLAAVADLDLSGYQSILWFSDDGARVPPSVCVDPGRVVVEAPDAATPTRAISALDRLIQRDALRLPSIFLAEEGVNDASGRFLPIVEAVVSQCETHQRARLTRQQVGYFWQRHLLTNLSAYARRRVPRSGARALAGVPAFVCGSGPSLDASGPKLAAAAERGVVFAADSALGALDRLGVAVDFAVSIDATKTPEKCVPRDARRAERLVAATVSPPTWREVLGDERVAFLSGCQITENWLAELGLARTAISTAGNCGITAVELAIHLGCAPIYLFGMDNAVDGQGSGRLHQRHFDTRLLGDDRLREGANYPKVPGNYQPEIATPFLREWRMLDARCAELPAGLVVNVIDRGARLRNTTLVHPDAFSVAGTPGRRPAALSRLPAPEPIGADEWRRVSEHVRRVACSAAAPVGHAAAALRAGDRPAVVRHLATAFREQAFAQLMGNFGLKVMPHLLQPDLGNAQLWTNLVAECEELIGLAAQLR
jgi:hypothetical protein